MKDTMQRSLGKRIAFAFIRWFLRFLLDNTYKSEVDLRNDLQLPVLGVIPDYDCCLKQKNEGKEGKYYGKV